MSIANILVPNNYHIYAGTTTFENLEVDTLQVDTQSTLNTLTTINGIVNIHANSNFTNSVALNSADETINSGNLTINSGNLMINSGNIINGGNYTYSGSGGQINTNSFTVLLVPVSGMSSVNFQRGQWFQIKNSIIVSFSFTYVSAGATTPIFTSSIPVARSVSGNFASSFDVIGSGSEFDTGNNNILGVLTEAIAGVQTINTTCQQPSGNGLTIRGNITYQYNL